MSRIVIVGQQPSRPEDEGTVLPVRPGSSGSRLIQMMGVTEEAFRKNFDLINVSPRYDPDGFSCGGHSFIPEAMNIRPLLVGRRVVLLGSAVATAFQIERSRYEWCQWFDHPKWDDHHGVFCVIPHPSGMNRVYNDPFMFGLVKSQLDFMWQMRENA